VSGSRGSNVPFERGSAGASIRVADTRARVPPAVRTGVGRRTVELPGAAAVEPKESALEQGHPKLTFAVRPNVPGRVRRCGRVRGNERQQNGGDNQRGVRDQVFPDPRSVPRYGHATSVSRWGDGRRRAADRESARPLIAGWRDTLRVDRARASSSDGCRALD
jgi:hypothetical protein